MKENANGFFFFKQKTAYEIADKRRGDDDGAWADHAHGHRHQELALVEPARLLHESLFEEWHDDESAAEGQRPRLQEEREELAQHRAGGGRSEEHTSELQSPMYLV